MLHFYYTNFVSMNTVNVVSKHDWIFPGTNSGRISNEWKKKKSKLFMMQIICLAAINDGSL